MTIQLPSGRTIEIPTPNRIPTARGNIPVQGDRVPTTPSSLPPTASGPAFPRVPGYPRGRPRPQGGLYGDEK